MTQATRICVIIGAIACLILMPTAGATHSPGNADVASFVLVQTTRNQGFSQGLFFGAPGEVYTSAMAGALPIDATIAQSNIPNVLVPSIIPSAEPPLPTTSPTPQPSTTLTNTSSAATTKSGVDLIKVISDISPYLIIALIPLLFIIGALFYFFFMGDQDRGASGDDEEGGVQFTDAAEETGWRELK